MPLLANEVMDESASVYLNDASRTRWSYAVLLPYLRSSWLELQAALEENDLPPLYEISAVLSVNANAVELAAPPADLVLPISLEERAVGETSFERMDELSWEPDATPDEKLRLWVYREGKIQFLGATTARQVRLRYTRSLSTIATEASTIEIPNAKGFLAARTAGLAATFGGRATERGGEANARAELFKKAIIGGLVKRMQDRPVRRRRYPYAAMRRGH